MVRGVAQPGSASALGAEGRVFESRRSERVYVNGKRFGFQPEDEGSIPSTRKKCSSVGRALVSKAGCRGFESCHFWRL